MLVIRRQVSILETVQLMPAMQRIINAVQLRGLGYNLKNNFTAYDCTTLNTNMVEVAHLKSNINRAGNLHSRSKHAIQPGV